MRIKLTSLNIVSYDTDSRKKIRFVEEMEQDVLINAYFEDVIKRFLDKRKDAKNIEIGYGYLVEDEKKLVGFVQPIRIHKDNVLDINYAVHPDFRRKGYGTRILKEISDYYFSNSDIKNIRLYISKNNIRSIGCAEKAGFYKESELEKYNLHVYMKSR